MHIKHGWYWYDYVCRHGSFSVYSLHILLKNHSYCQWYHVIACMSQHCIVNERQVKQSALKYLFVCDFWLFKSNHCTSRNILLHVRWLIFATNIYFDFCHSNIRPRFLSSAAKWKAPLYWFCSAWQFELHATIETCIVSYIVFCLFYFGFRLFGENKQGLFH